MNVKFIFIVVIVVTSMLITDLACPSEELNKKILIQPGIGTSA